LRPGVEGVVFTESFLFQSHAGSIEAIRNILKYDAGGKSFNPTLVRLRRYAVFIDASWWNLFQSHAGSIEAIMNRGNRIDIELVSIPRWFD